MLAHLAYHVHKGGHKTSIIIIIEENATQYVSYSGRSSISGQIFIKTAIQTEIHKCVDDGHIGRHFSQFYLYK